MSINIYKLRRFIGLIFVLIIMLAGCSNIPNQPDPKYPIGRDTIKAFGDATFQIQKSSDGKHVLLNESNNAEIDENVYAYKEKGELVYTLGAIGYTIINTKTSEVIQLRDFNGYSKKDKKSYGLFNKGDFGKLILVKDFNNFTEKERKVFKDLRDSVKSNN